MRRPSQHGNKKKKILRIAIRLFKKEGFHNVSVEDIVRATETSIAAFYSYFGAKEEVVCFYRNDALSRCEAFFRQLTEDEAWAGCDARRRLSELLLYIMRLLDEVGPEFGRIFAQCRLKEAAYGQQDKPYLPMIRSLMEQGQAAGEIRDDFSAEQLTTIADRLLTGAYLRWQLHWSEEPMHELETETVAMFCAAISPDRARQTAHGAPLHDIWETALYMLIPDPRSGIKQVEEDWLERFYKSD